jgi:hypothetical protein
MFRLPMFSSAFNMVLNANRLKQSSTSTVRRGGLSTKKQKTSDCPINQLNSPQTIPTTMNFMTRIRHWLKATPNIVGLLALLSLSALESLASDQIPGAPDPKRDRPYRLQWNPRQPLPSDQRRKDRSDPSRDPRRRGFRGHRCPRQTPLPRSLRFALLHGARRNRFDQRLGRQRRNR